MASDAKQGSQLKDKGGEGASAAFCQLLELTSVGSVTTVSILTPSKANDFLMSIYKEFSH